MINLDAHRELVGELLLLKFGEALHPGIEQAYSQEFLDQSFDEIISEAEREDPGSKTLSPYPNRCFARKGRTKVVVTAWSGEAKL